MKRCIINKYLQAFVLPILLLNSCKNKNSDYEILNIAAKEGISPNGYIFNKKYNEEFDTLSKSPKYSGYSKIAINSMAVSNVNENYNYTFTISDTLFTVPYSYGYSLWGNSIDNIKQYYKGNEKYEKNKINFRKNYTFLKSEKDTLKHPDKIYLGYFSMSRIMYSYGGVQAYIRFVNKKNGDTIGITTVELEKKDGKWK